jgi:hypothetical protein
MTRHVLSAGDGIDDFKGLGWQIDAHRALCLFREAL